MPNKKILEDLKKKYMQFALLEANKALLLGEVPVGAVVVLGNKVIARAYNKTISLNDPSAHAEILVLRKAAYKIKNYRLISTKIFVTLEPCVMCAGAILNARVKELIFGTPSIKTGAIISAFNILTNKKNNHLIKIEHGILKESCSQILTLFFKKKRKISIQ